MNRDLEQLRLLSIFHYVVGGICAVFSLFPVIHLVIGLLLLSGVIEADGPDAAMMPLMGALFTGVATIIITMGMSLAVCLIMVGKRLTERRSYTFCFVVACVECVFMPMGTVLGVFTIIVLNRPSVRALFGVDDGPAQNLATF